MAGDTKNSAVIVFGKLISSSSGSWLFQRAGMLHCQSWRHLALIAHKFNQFPLLESAELTIYPPIKGTEWTGQMRRQHLRGEFSLTNHGGAAGRTALTPPEIRGDNRCRFGSEEGPRPEMPPAHFFPQMTSDAVSSSSILCAQQEVGAGCVSEGTADAAFHRLVTETT